jgi:hypothetical protein
MRKRTWRWWTAVAVLAALALASAWYFLRPGQQQLTLDAEPGNPTPVPPLAGVVEQIEADTDKAVARYSPKQPGRIDDLPYPSSTVSRNYRVCSTSR